LCIDKAGRPKNVAKNKPTKIGAGKHTIKYTTYPWHRNHSKPKPRP
jgi:hypothetical protein